jgi:hypothetical protein
MQKWISIACASLLLAASLGGVLFGLLHATGLRSWMVMVATLCVLAGSYWVCIDLAAWTEDTRTTGEG